MFYMHSLTHMYFKSSIVCIHVRLLTVIFFFPCLFGGFLNFVAHLLPPVGQKNRVEPFGFLVLFLLDVHVYTFAQNKQDTDPLKTAAS